MIWLRAQSRPQDRQPFTSPEMRWESPMPTRNTRLMKTRTAGKIIPNDERRYTHSPCACAKASAASRMLLFPMRMIRPSLSRSRWCSASRFLRSLGNPGVQDASLQVDEPVLVGVSRLLYPWHSLTPPNGGRPAVGNPRFSTPEIVNV